MNGEDKHNEWYFQSDYDLETAKDMLKSGRNVYCIFMCHLSVEKALKGLFVKTTKQYPPKTHNLTFFIDKIGLKPETEDFAFLHSLNKVSIPTRYPDDLRKLFTVFTDSKTTEIVMQTEKLQKWIKKH